MIAIITGWVSPGHTEIMHELISLDVSSPVWDRFFTVAPLVVVGTRDAQGRVDFAPKHMAMPLSWENYFGFVCSPRHQTLVNLAQSGQFTISYPRPEQVLELSLAASPRCGDEGDKPSLEALATMKAEVIEGEFLQGADICLECRLHTTVPDLGPNTLVIGRVVAAHVHPDALRTQDRDDHDLIHRHHLLAYLAPGRFARVDESQAFPFPRGFSR